VAWRAVVSRRRFRTRETGIPVVSFLQFCRISPDPTPFSDQVLKRELVQDRMWTDGS
jgi:hypothetical protein